MNSTDLCVIIPARNEEDNIKGCLDALMVQTYNDFNIIVVNDQSEDKTEEIVQNFIKQHSRIKLISVDNKPDGWVGKNHALYLGQLKTSTEWILFMDADVRISPDCIEKSCKMLTDKNIDMLSYAAFQECKTIWEKSVQPLMFFILNILYPLKAMLSGESQQVAANGIFMLVKRSIYNIIGTHESIKSIVLEDVELARRVKAAGGKVYFSFEPDLISVRMYQNLNELFEGWSKNFFALLQFSYTKAVLLFVILLMVFWMPFIALISGFWTLYSAFAFIFIECICFSYVCHKMKYKFYVGFLLPVGSTILVIILLNSIISYKFKGKVKWKNRQYKVK